MGSPVCIRNGGNGIFLYLNVPENGGKVLRNVPVDGLLLVHIKASSHAGFRRSESYRSNPYEMSSFQEILDHLGKLMPIDRGSNADAVRRIHRSFPVNCLGNTHRIFSIWFAIYRLLPVPVK